jgi:hypothetical protein
MINSTVLRQLLHDVLENVDSHPKMVMKVAFGKFWIFHEIALHQLVLAFYHFPPQFMSTENKTTMLRPFIRMHVQ